MNGKTKTWHISNIEYTYYFKALNRLQNKSLSKIFAPKSVIRGIVFTNNPIWDNNKKKISIHKINTNKKHKTRSPSSKNLSCSNFMETIISTSYIMLQSTECPPKTLHKKSREKSGRSRQISLKINTFSQKNRINP